MATKAQLEANQRYHKTQDELKIRIRKGHKVELQEHAAAHGETLNKFVNRAIAETVERDNELLK